MLARRYASGDGPEKKPRRHQTNDRGESLSETNMHKQPCTMGRVHSQISSNPAAHPSCEVGPTRRSFGLFEGTRAARSQRATHVHMIFCAIHATRGRRKQQGKLRGSLAEDSPLVMELWQLLHAFTLAKRRQSGVWQVIGGSTLKNSRLIPRRQFRNPWYEPCIFPASRLRG